MDKDRLNYLDSMRGIASLVVVLFHCWLLNAKSFRVAYHTTAHVDSLPNLLFYLLSKLNESGRSAVMLFFVLSGFVLAYSLRKNPLPYAAYALRRVFRIYPAFLFVILASYALHSFIGFGADPGAGDQADSGGAPGLSLLVLAKHLALWGTAGSRRLDIVIWSLVHEMRISLIFPLILWAVGTYRWRAVFALWLFSVACTLANLYATGTVVLGFEEDSFAGTFRDTGFFVCFFAAGACLAIERERWAAAVAALPGWACAGFGAVVACCLLKTDYNNHAAAGSVVDYLRGMGALGLIALALGRARFRRALNHGVLIWLGRISYSLYLMHMPVIYVVTRTFGAAWDVLPTGIVVIALSLLIADLTARLIEFPAIALGKKLYARQAV